VIFYAAASWSNQFIYDDHEVIENQFPLHHAGDVEEIFRTPHYLNFPYYRPLTRLTFAVQKTIWGDWPRPYHLFNALLAGGVMLAAYALLRRPAFFLYPSAATCAALWLAVHPAFSECVYPAASGGESLLPALFILLSVWAYLGNGSRNLIVAHLFFLIAILCKEQAAVLPGIFFLADVLGLRDATCKKKALSYLPILLILAGYFLLRQMVFQSPTMHWEFLQHPFDPFKSLLYGIQTAFCPFALLHYEPPYTVWFETWRSAAASILFALIFLLTFREKKLRKIGLFWLGWFVLLQLPTAHILRQEAPYSERYAALAILGIAATAAALWRYFPKAGPLALPRMIAAAVVFIWIGFFAFQTFLRASYYTDDITFAGAWLKTNPNSASAHNGLALIAQQRGQYPIAIDQYRQALECDPNSATAHNNLANLLADQGKFAEAAQHFQWMLQQDPRDTIAMVNYAQMLGQQAYAQHDPHLRDQARQLLDQAIKQRPTYAQAHYILGVWQEAFGDPQSASAEFQTALRLRPDLADAQKRLDLLQSKTPTTR
jgi:tetratricopeptide (TPR) repeat protein